MKILMKTICIAALLGFGASHAWAQDLMDHGAEATISEETIQSMSDTALETMLNQNIDDIQKVIQQAGDYLQEARTAEDITRMDYINEKLISLKGFLGIAQNSYVNVFDAIKRKDDAAKLHHVKLSNMASSRCIAMGNEIHFYIGANVEQIEAVKLQTTRVCSIEPCLDGEEIINPPSEVLDIPFADASPYR